jgi:hypothetical protein
MVGAWRGEAGTRTLEEFWTPANDDTMLGVNRTSKGSQTSFFEYLRIEKQKDGIYYLASPKGRCPAIAFKLVESAAQRAAFENPEHDFPQRIIYWREGDAMHARIEGTQKGRPKASQWSWQKASLEAK